MLYCGGILVNITLKTDIFGAVTYIFACARICCIYFMHLKFHGIKSHPVPICVICNCNWIVVPRVDLKSSNMHTRDLGGGW